MHYICHVNPIIIDPIELPNYCVQTLWKGVLNERKFIRLLSCFDNIASGAGPGRVQAGGDESIKFMDDELKRSNAAV